LFDPRYLIMIMSRGEKLEAFSSVVGTTCHA